MGRLAALSSGFLLLASALVPALAQDAETIPFAGGAFTITEQDDAMRVLAYDGVEIARDYFIFFDGTAEVDGAEIALFEISEGGNACGANTLIAWKPEGGDIEVVQATDDCDAPSAAIGPYGVYFVPYLLPGEAGHVRVWTPLEGLRVAGLLTYSSQPGSGWESLAMPDHMIDVFANEAVHDASRALLGADLTEVVRGLSVGGAPTAASPDLFWSRGCVPHACGLNDSFMAVDRAQREVYFAQQQENGPPRSWPDAAGWPPALRDAMAGALGR